MADSVIGIIPAAGKAERMGGLPKWALPIPDGHLLGAMCERMRHAGAESLLVGANSDNRGLIEQYVPPSSVVYTINSRTMSETVKAARRWAGNSVVLFGMPDSYWAEDPFIFRNLRWSVEDPTIESIVSVAVWRTRPGQERKLGMVAVNSTFTQSFTEQYLEISKIIDKPTSTELTHAWGAIAWQPAFWEFITPEDPHVGYALQRAMAAGVKVRAVLAKGSYWDCGTPDEYFKLIRSLEL